MLDARRLVELLGLEPHPEEGGFFREVYRSRESLAADALPARYGAARSVSTAIYYLLTPQTFSEMHRLLSDEVFHFYLGDPVEQLQLAADGTGKTVLLGSDVEAGQMPQGLVPAGVWQGAWLLPGGAHGWALLGATVAPGFDFADYEPGHRAELTAAYPDFAEAIAGLTRRE